MTGKQKEQLPGMPEIKFDIGRWWAETTMGDREAFAPKFKEYGSNDLVEIGRTMLAVAGRDEDDDQVCAEAGIYFYLVGKIARWTEALQRGDRPSDDTLHDISTYAMMARLNRAGGMVR